MCAVGAWLTTGEEIARHIAREAREVLHCARTFTGPGTARQPPAAAAAGQHATAAAAAAHHDKQQQQHQQPQQPPPEQQQGAIPPAPEPRPNITRHSMLSELRPDGSAVLVGGQVVRGVDAIVYCTGYKYSLPWMDHLGLVQEGDWGCRPSRHMAKVAGLWLKLSVVTEHAQGHAAIEDVSVCVGAMSAAHFQGLVA